MSNTLSTTEEKSTPKKSKSKFQDNFSIDDKNIIEAAPASNFKPMYYAVDRQKKNFVSCDNIKATALDPTSNSFEFEALIFSTRGNSI